MSDRETFFLNKLFARVSLRSESFKGVDEARQKAEALAQQPELKNILRAQNTIRYHELDHALGDVEVEGHIQIDIISIGITTRKEYVGYQIVLGQYVPEGRERTFEEMEKIALSVSNPSIIDRYSVLVNRNKKTGFKP